jgi:hypothetical protein
MNDTCADLMEESPAGAREEPPPTTTPPTGRQKSSGPAANWTEKQTARPDQIAPAPKQSSSYQRPPCALNAYSKTESEWNGIGKMSMPTHVHGNPSKADAPYLFM